MAAKADNVSEIQRSVSIEFIKNSGGYAVKAIKGEKAPAKGWDPRNNTKQRSDLLLDELANTDDNFGIHVHGALVDVDIDTDNKFLMQALEIFLPPCSHVWGRKSKPRSHRVYVTKSADVFDPSEHVLLKRLSKIPEANIELRGGPQTRGEFSLLPGSIHPSGEPYEWADLKRARSSPSVATVDALLRAVRLSGAIAVIAPHWTEGARNDLAMALAGFLFKAWQIVDGLGEEAFALDFDGAERFLEVLLDITQDDPEDRVARLKTFKMTWSKAEAGAPVTGATRIGEITGDKDIVGKLYTLLCDSPDVSAIDEFTSRFAIWQGPGLAIDMDGVKVGAQKVLMTRQQMQNSYGHRFIEIQGKRRLLADMLFNLKTTTRVAGLTFEPGQPLLTDSREGKMINEWGGFEIPPHDKPVKDKEIRPVLDYIMEVLADNQPDRYEWILGWVAAIFQEPANKVGTALVIVGIPGAGKSFLGHNIIVPIIGRRHAVTTNNADSITRDFNALFDNKIFVQGDEATNNRQLSSAARLRALITDPTKMIEPKGIDPYEKPNHTRFLFTSNDEENAIFLQGGTDDRRFTVFSANSCRKGQLQEYWHPFAKWCADKDNLAKVHRWLLDYKYDRHFIATPLVTEAKTVMQQRSWDTFDGWVASWLARGHPLHEDIHDHWYDAPIMKKQKIDRTEWPREIFMTALKRDYEHFVRTQGRRGADMLNESQLTMALKKRGLRPAGEGRMIRMDEYDSKRNKRVDKRVRLYPFPDRTDVERYLFRKYGVEAESVLPEELTQPTERDDDRQDF